MPLTEYVTGRRPAREALARIAWLPRGSAYQACAIARHGIPTATDADVPAEVQWFEWTKTAQMLADLWNAVAASAGGKATYPTPHERVKRRRARRARVDMAAFPALAAAAAHDSPTQ